MKFIDEANTTEKNIEITLQHFKKKTNGNNCIDWFQVTTTAFYLKPFQSGVHAYTYLHTYVHMKEAFNDFAKLNNNKCKIFTLIDCN